MTYMKILGLCLVVATAYTINVASASATDDLYECFAGEGCAFTAESSTAKFFIGKEEISREIKCKVSTLKGEVKTGASELDVTPAYKECTVFGGGEAKISVANCLYRFYEIEDIEPEPTDFLHSAKVLVIDANGNPCGIEITIPSIECKITIKKQGPLSGFEYLDEKEKGAEKYEQMKLTTHTTKLVYTGGTHCPEEGVKENGIYNETAIIMGVYLK